MSCRRGDGVCAMLHHHTANALCNVFSPGQDLVYFTIRTGANMGG